jgi:uncharacterized protein (TIGR03790 family)
MRNKRWVLLIALLTFLCDRSYAALSPQDVVVIYNKNDVWKNAQDVNVSKAVADYYCAARGIPQENEFGIDWQSTSPDIGVDQFLNQIVYDRPGIPGLTSFLASRPDFDVNDPSTDPTKVIVLCYGVPMRVWGPETANSVDSSLTLLFNGIYDASQQFHHGTYWGRFPLGNYGVPYGCFTNPFYHDSENKPIDFGELRSSDYNAMTETAPNFTVVRMLASNRAIAGGQRGMLYRGEKTGSAWDWTPVWEESKRAVRWDIVDICVLDQSTAIAATSSGAVIRTVNGGVTWSLVHSGASGWTEYDQMKSISFTASQDGWMVGQIGKKGERVILRMQGDWNWQTIWSSAQTGLDIPSSFVPNAVAAVDSTHVWVTGNDGVWFTSDGGTHWSQEYTSSNGTYDIWAGKNGTTYVAWAVDSAGTLLAYDNTTWSEVSGITVPSPITADMAGFDTSHVTLAYGYGSFLRYDGSTWTTDNSDSTGKTSAAWAGGDSVLSVSSTSPSIRNGTGSPGAYSWSTALTVPSFTWKARYMVCRLDGYSDPADPTTGIPLDIKNMIDRATSANNAGRSAYSNAKFVLDGPHSKGCGYSSSLIALLSDTVGTGNLIDEETSVWLDQNQAITGDVVGYSSTGSYHSGALNITRWWRPLNLTWKDGAIGMYQAVSGDAVTLRTPNFVWEWAVDSDPTHIESGKLKVHFWWLGSDPNNHYNTHWVGLYSSTGTLLASAPFDRTETLTRIIKGTSYTDTVRTSVIDLSTVDWQGNENTYVTVSFPSDDSFHPNGVLYRSATSNAIYQARTAGTSYYAGIGQSLGTELIRAGCSATAGNVTEPFASACPVPEVIFRQYARGCNWAESAYMGLPVLSWMEVAAGDPLMAPYAVHPTVDFATPSPSDGNHVRGSVSLCATATPDGDGTIQRVEFWIKGTQLNKLIGTDTQSPYECVWDTEALSDGNRIYPNGSYTIEAVAYQAGNQIGTSTVSRSVELDDTISAVTITNPQNDNSVVDSATQLAAQVSPSAGTLKFWLLGNGDPIQLDGSYVPTAVTDGEYQLQAIATDHTNSPFFSSYSSRRPIRVVDNFAASVGGLGSFSNGTTVYIAGTPVVAGSSPAIDYPLTQGHAFYLEDAGRCTGIRVVGADPVQTGRNVSVLGVLHVGSGVSERYIEATQVWDDGAANVPAPVGMSNLWLGGKDTDDRYGQTNPGIGNVGLLARAWGTVTYVDATNKFAYIDDGSNIQDGNSLSAVGIRVYFGDLPVPTVDSYMTITGISSVELIGGYRERMLRAAASYSDSCSGAVTYVGSDFVYVDDGTHPWDGNEITAPRIVPQDGSAIPAAVVGVLGRKVYFGSLTKPGIDDEVSITGQSYYSYADGRPAPMTVSSPSDLTYVERYIPARSTTSGIVAIADPYTVLPAGTKIRLTDANVHGVETGYFFVRPAGNWPAISCAVPTALVGGDTVTITGEVLSGRDQNGYLRMDPGPGHIYLGGSQYGAMSVSPQGLATMSVSSLSTSGRTDGTEGGGPFRPWPYPTAEEILASDSFQRQYSQVGAIGWALSQPDGSVIDLPAEGICGEWYDGRVIGLREWFEPIPNGPRLFLYLDQPIKLDTRFRDMATIDIVAGKLVTLSGGVRALVKPEAVYAYTDSTGQSMFPLPWPKFVGRSGIADGSENWPWKTKVAP